MDDILSSISSLGFGAMLGGGVFGLLYVLFPEAFPGASSFKEVAILGALVGGGAHRLIDIWFVQGLLGPIGRYSAYYAKLVQLVLLRPLIGRHRQQELLQELTRRFFLDDLSTVPERDKRLLP